MSRPDLPANSGEPAEPLRANRNWLVVLFWLVVGVPLAWGIYRTVLQAAQLFR